MWSKSAILKAKLLPKLSNLGFGSKRQALEGDPKRSNLTHIYIAQYSTEYIPPASFEPPTTTHPTTQLQKCTRLFTEFNNFSTSIFY